MLKTCLRFIKVTIDKEGNSFRDEKNLTAQNKSVALEISSSEVGLTWNSWDSSRVTSTNEICW